MAQANENDEEVLEQLVQAAETGDVAILRTLLTDHHDLASRAPRRARRWPRCRGAAAGRPAGRAAS